MTATVDRSTDKAQPNAARKQQVPKVPQHAVALWVGLQAALGALPGRTPCGADPTPWLADLGSPGVEELHAYAVAHCAGCPVLDRCRAYALGAREPSGVWGATTPRERGFRQQRGEVATP